MGGRESCSVVGTSRSGRGWTMLLGSFAAPGGVPADFEY